MSLDKLFHIPTGIVDVISRRSSSSPSTHSSASTTIHEEAVEARSGHEHRRIEIDEQQADRSATFESCSCAQARSPSATPFESLDVCWPHGRNAISSPSSQYYSKRKKKKKKSNQNICISIFTSLTCHSARVIFPRPCVSAARLLIYVFIFYVLVYLPLLRTFCVFFLSLCRSLSLHPCISVHTTFVFFH